VEHFTNEILEAADAWQPPISDEDDAPGSVFAMVSDTEHTTVNRRVLVRGTTVAKYLESRTALIACPKGRNTS